MRHNKSGRRLGRNSSHRSAMMRNMVTSLIEHEKITTTDARAKELRKIAEKMITFGKRGDLHARRQAMQVIRERKVVAKLFDMVAPRYKDRPGGYTRIVKMGSRPGDNAALSIVELVEEEFTARPLKKANAPEEAEVKPAVSVPVAEESVPEEAKAQETDVGESVDQEPVAGVKKEEKV